MKCSDIPDDLFMAAVEATAPMTSGGTPWRHRRDVHATLNGMLGAELPEKLFLAKARKLGEKRKLMGCTRCTCRGDYHTPRECHANRCCCSPEYDWRAHPAYDPSWEADEPVPPDPEALPKAIEAIRALAALPSSPPALVPFDLSNPSALLYPAGYVKPPPPAFLMKALGL